MNTSQEVCGWTLVKLTYCWAVGGHLKMEGFHADALAEAMCM